ncbi:NYN domain-containing protein [Hankyongella ginsenosidimutans]|uniref:NYN domain-containing protein n=1 Tax=Hankyongella ginsenosidimutans TaxID=1763828 RepID=A0A4D7C9J5_9SPHN|nr:NYN domain-containing protein [Hankyongella ginsenosidimutans]QCI79607.1 NYN domain-containing protein [Hankyongella ginsenosidimutans]
MAPKQSAVKRWLSGTANFVPDDEDFELDVVQKGVDMRLGLDVASMAYKRQVDQIVMVTADADFVPAAKLARREGIDVVLDPMNAKAAADLLEHVDGVRNCKLPNVS